MFDSNGPTVRVRGNAHQVLEKYLALARDATTAGDRVSAENFYQHAEHYFRIANPNGTGQDRGGPRADGHGPDAPQPAPGNGELVEAKGPDGAGGPDGDGGPDGAGGPDGDGGSDGAGGPDGDGGARGPSGSDQAPA